MIRRGPRPLYSAAAAANSGGVVRSRSRQRPGGREAAGRENVFAVAAWIAAGGGDEVAVAGSEVAVAVRV